MTTPYHLEFRNYGEELQVTIRGGERSPENALAAWVAIASEVRVREPRRLLALSHVDGGKFERGTHCPPPLWIVAGAAKGAMPSAVSTSLG